MSDDPIVVAFDVRSPDMSDEELFDLAVASRHDIAQELRAALDLPPDLPGDALRVEVSRGSIHFFIWLAEMAFHGAMWAGKHAADAGAGDAAIIVVRKAPGVIKRVLGRKAKEKAKTQSLAPATVDPPPQFIVNNFYGDPEKSETYNAFLDYLASLGEDELEAYLAGLPEALREAIRKDVLRRRGMGGHRQPVKA